MPLDDRIFSAMQLKDKGNTYVKVCADHVASDNNKVSEKRRLRVSRRGFPQSPSLLGAAVRRGQGLLSAFHRAAAVGYHAECGER